MRVKLPEFGTKKELFEHLVKNKKSLIDKKKSMVIHGMEVKSSPSCLAVDSTLKKEFASKGISVKQEDLDLPEGTIRVKTVANAAGFIDSHFDLLVRDSPKKSINERKDLLVHLHDHIHTTEAEVGDVVDVLLQDVPLMELGWNEKGSTQCVVFITDIKEEYNKKIYDRYKKGKAKQHSIGLQYVRIELAINDPDYEKEKDFFDKYYDQVINKEIADEYGFFWVVLEYKLIENSVVLFGSNQYTPTLEVLEPGDKSTQKSEPDVSTRRKEALNELLNSFKKINLE